MQSFILTAAMVILVALAGCSNPTQAPNEQTPSPAPTPTQVPSPTQEPTAATVPTVTPSTPPTTIPTPMWAATATLEAPSTQAPKGERQTGVLSPLNLDRREAEEEDINSELSEAELDCIKEIGPFMPQRWDFILQGYGHQEERVKIIGCLEDETVARIFVADTAEGVATLSLETSTWLRAAFNEINPRSMMLAQV